MKFLGLTEFIAIIPPPSTFLIGFHTQGRYLPQQLAGLLVEFQDPVQLRLQRLRTSRICSSNPGNGVFGVSDAILVAFDWMPISKN